MTDAPARTLDDIRRAGVLVHLRVRYDGQEWTTPVAFRWINGKWQTEQRRSLPGHLAVVGWKQTEEAVSE